MSINTSEFVKTKEKNIKVSKTDRYLFLFDFRISNRRYRYLYRSEAIASTPKDLLASARVELEKRKGMIRDGGIQKRMTVTALFDKYNETQPATEWTEKKKSFYDLYIKKDLGNMDIVKIRPMQIEEIIFRMKKKGLSARTCRSILEVLNPLFKYAVKNRLLDENPARFVTIEVPSQKKKVIDGIGMFKKLYAGIMELYADDPKYRALFLFAWSGRRKSEVLNLRWENINFDKGYYWILDSKNGEDQKYPLPPAISEALYEMIGDKHGYIFKGRSGNGKLSGVNHQLQKLRKKTGIQKLTLHYMRNILVTALSDESVEAVNLSGILGHKDINTINKYLSNSTMKSGLKALETIDSILDAEIIVEGDTDG